MKQKWLNWVLHLTSRIFKQKEKILIAGTLETVFLLLYIILLELTLFIVSLPTYVFVTPSSLGTMEVPDRAVMSYRLRRKIALSAILIMLGYWLVNILVAFLLSAVVAPIGVR